MYSKIYPTIALGGTFDHFHLGHQSLIDFAAQLGELLVIGITDASMIADKQYSQTIETFAQRKLSVLNYCHRQKIQCKIVTLTDAYGPTLNEQSAPAIAVTSETMLGAKKINDLRQKMNLKAIFVHVCEMKKDNTGQIISSSRIRAGEINRQGLVYAQTFSQDLLLNEQQRHYFSQMQGELVDEPTFEAVKVAVVGDRSLFHFLTNRYRLDLGIFDFKQKRQPDDSLKSFIKQPNFIVNNPAGQITSQLVQTIHQALASGQSFLQINGEDDLATVALVLNLPLQSAVYYGQPDKGMVEIEITEKLKNDFAKILSN